MVRKPSGHLKRPPTEAQRAAYPAIASFPFVIASDAWQSHSRLKRKQPLMLKERKTNQKGFTLIEMLIAVAIAGLIVAAAAGAVVQLIQSSDTTAHMLAVRQVQQAGYWVSTDGLQAQYVSASGPEGFPLHFWNSHDVTYNLTDPNADGLHELHRIESESDMTVAKYLTPNTTCSWNATAGLLTFTVEASVRGARGRETETRTYEVTPRALL